MNVIIPQKGEDDLYALTVRENVPGHVAEFCPTPVTTELYMIGDGNAAWLE